jgi:hypothetical protein
MAPASLSREAPIHLNKGPTTVTIKRLLSIAALVGLVVASAVAQAPDPLLGTWKLNAAKSKAPYASGTTVFEGPPIR